MKQEKQQQQLTWIVRPPFTPSYTSFSSMAREIATAAAASASARFHAIRLPSTVTHPEEYVALSGGG